MESLKENSYYSLKDGIVGVRGDENRCTCKNRLFLADWSGSKGQKF